MTFNEYGEAMLAQIEAAYTEATSSDAWLDAMRDLVLAKDHLNDALTRYNSARYRTKGTWVRRDPDKD